MGGSRWIEKILLIGMMSTGKSTVGQKLAERFGWAFVDLDQQVEQRVGMTVEQIFDRYGEAVFRQREEEALHAGLGLKRAVIATGGGVVLSETNRRAICRQSDGYCIFLNSQPDTLIERLNGKQHGHRPLLREKDWPHRLRTLVKERDRLYHVCADQTVSTDRCSVDQITQLLDKSLRDKICLN